MRYAACDYCGARYQQRHDWQTLCPDCYRLREQNGGKDAWMDVIDLKQQLSWAQTQLASATRQASATRAELAILAHIKSNSRAWLSLVHPDRHDGSRAANEATMMILSLRNEKGTR